MPWNLKKKQKQNKKVFDSTWTPTPAPLPLNPIPHGGYFPSSAQGGEGVKGVQKHKNFEFELALWLFPLNRLLVARI